MLRHFVGLAAAGAAAAARAPPAAGAPRGLRATPAPRALGVLEQLTNAAPASLAGGGVCGKSALWEVVEFRAGGAAIETWKSPDGLGLHPRDVSLFTAPRGGAAARALLAPRPGALLLRTEAARAVIQHDRAVRFSLPRLLPSQFFLDTTFSSASTRTCLPLSSLRLLPRPHRLTHPPTHPPPLFRRSSSPGASSGRRSAPRRRSSRRSPRRPRASPLSCAPSRLSSPRPRAPSTPRRAASRSSRPRSSKIFRRT
jgi:hypothetical protein